MKGTSFNDFNLAERIVPICNVCTRDVHFHPENRSKKSMSYLTCEEKQRQIKYLNNFSVSYILACYTQNILYSNCVTCLSSRVHNVCV